MKLVFKYRGGDWSVVKRDLRSLYKNEIYAAPFHSLNDPFESMCFIDHNLFNENGAFSKLLDFFKIGKLKGKMQKIDLSFQAATNEFLDFSKKMGVYSLSQTVTDEALWAYYANSHQGFCLAFDLEQLLTYSLQQEDVLTVNYSNKPPSISTVELIRSLNSEDGKKRLMQKLVATKSLRWKFEEEIRICVGQAGLREYDFRALKAVYFGVRCQTRLIRLAMRLLRGRGLKYYQMTLSEKSYELTPREIHDEFMDAIPYRMRLAPVDDGVPYIDDKIISYEKELKVAVEMARREPYCERVTDAYLSSLPGTPENPVFYVTYDRSDGFSRNIFYSLNSIMESDLYK